MRMTRTILAIAALTMLAAPAGAQQTILGSAFKLKQKPGAPERRTFEAKAKESSSPNVLTGDPAANGATVTVFVNGVTFGSQTFTLPGGTAWTRYDDPWVPGTAFRWKYKDTFGTNSSLTGLDLTARNGLFLLKAKANARHGSGISILPPNPGSYAGVVVTINGPGGDSYCVNFGGAAGGYFASNVEKALSIKKPTGESVCPTVSPTCGDGVAQPPFEACEVGDDAACPGLCGVNGIPCQCPVCGDGVQDPSEACDGTALGSCAEGCTHACACTTCGDDVAEGPEDCDGTDDAACPGLCGAPGNASQCRCPVCGDNSVNAPGEVCDGTDDAACPGLCVADTCQCATCGDDSVNVPGEVCDGDDDSACRGRCILAGQPNQCTCATCGNDVREIPAEDCDGTDDADCPGMCSVDCYCP